MVLRGLVKTLPPGFHIENGYLCRRTLLGPIRATTAANSVVAHKPSAVPCSGVCGKYVRGSAFGQQPVATNTQGGAIVDPRHKPPSGSQRADQDFVDRFRQGPGAISDDEASSRYEQVAPNLPPDVYQRSAQEVFARLDARAAHAARPTLVQSARQQA